MASNSRPPSGETVALLKGKDGTYTGTRFEDGRTLTLSADGAAVASTTSSHQKCAQRAVPEDAALFVCVI